MMRDHQYEDLLRDGITAAKSGEHKTAQWLLKQAAQMRPADARPYVWLSATTADLKEKIDYLEEALARDPSNSAARRGLVVLSGRLNPDKVLAQGAGLEVQPLAGEVDAQAQSFKCPQCGGHLIFEAGSGELSCQYCGFSRPIAKSVAGSASSVDQDVALDLTLPTTSGHQWARTQHRLACVDCGAVSALPPGQAATQCAYCGSNQLVEAPEMAELIDPQAIIPMQIDEQKAIQHVKQWLKRGFFAPDNLLHGSQGLRLRPAYYSAWTFDGAVEYRWSCEVNQGNSRDKRWVHVSGSNTQFFDDVLIPGVKALTESELKSIEPFDLKKMPDFEPQYLAGWPAMIYDRSLADATLLGREMVMRDIRARAYSQVQPGKEKRNLTIGGGSWSGVTFKHILLPLWIGTYHYEHKQYHVLVNGSSGKVGGYKPLDKIKILFTILVAIMAMVLLGVLYWLLTKPG